MSDPFGSNAHHRERLIELGLDVSFSRLLLPLIIDLIYHLPNHKSLSVLEIGCGTGSFTRHLARVVGTAVGVDLSQGSIEYAKENTSLPNVSYECASIASYDAPPESFDAVVAFMSLHAIDNLHAALSKVASLLKTGGKFIIALPHPCFWYSLKSSSFAEEVLYMESSRHEIEYRVSKSTEPLPSRTPYFHRPLSTYSDIIFEVGLVIERLIEPYPDDSLMQEYPSPWTNPQFLILVTAKIGEV